jgi:lipopolysaccharide transport system permease protein
VTELQTSFLWLRTTLFTGLSALNILKIILAYRGFILGSVKREFQLKYSNSIFGASWTIFNPLAMIIVYTVVFSQVMKARLPGVDSSFAYSIYLCSGVLTWGLFAEIISRGQNSFLEFSNIIKKVNFPRICIPAIYCSSSIVNFSIIFFLFTLFLLVTGNFPGWVFFLIFPFLILQIVFSLGLSIIIGILNVFFRDVGQFVTIILQFWFWFTPIVYPLTVLPEKIRFLMILNPMATFVSAYQAILVRHEIPRFFPFVWIMVLSVLLCCLSLYLFRRRIGEMVDEL